MALKLRTAVLDFLKARQNQKFTARQIAEYIIETFPTECDEKIANSKATVIPIVNHAMLAQQLVAEIGSNRPAWQKKHTELRTTDARPKQYYFSNASEAVEVKTIEDSDDGKSELGPVIKVRETNLYPILSDFLHTELGLHSKRIDEKKSSNKQGKSGNHWLYPDMVALENLSQDWHSEIKDAAKQGFDKLTRLWSFEVKILVNRSNVREVFFQTVSNSSWANFGYLVASEVGEGTLKELRILSGLHGIGFIELNIENPTESTILIPAREKMDIDWNTANRLAVENKDFTNYIKSIRQFYQTGEVKLSDWDDVQIKLD